VRTRAALIVALAIVTLSSGPAPTAWATHGIRQPPEVVYRVRRPSLRIKLVIQGHWIVYRSISAMVICERPPGRGRWRGWVGINTGERIRIERHGQFYFKLLGQMGASSDDLLSGRVEGNQVQGTFSEWTKSPGGSEEGDQLECGTGSPKGRAMHFTARRVSE
jgi:hypothetical protein